MRYFAIALVILALIAAGWWYFTLETKEPTSEIVPEESVSAPTDFVKAGYITVNSPGNAQGEMYLVYEEPGAPALTKKLELDPLSICAAPNGATPCIAISITYDVVFGGKRAVVEGTDKGDSVLVRKLNILAEGEEPLLNAPGSIFISWPAAVALIEACQVEMAMQTHSLDVYLTLKNGGKIRAVEPTIDTMFGVIDGASARCGTIPVATE